MDTSTLQVLVFGSVVLLLACVVTYFHLRDGMDSKDCLQSDRPKTLL